MNARADRQRLVAQARLLDAIGAPAPVGPRAARLARRLNGRAETPLAFADVAAAPDWAAWPVERRARLADFAAAAACTEVLQRTIDGRRLARVARRIGEPALDAVLASPPGLVAAIPQAQAALADDEAFSALGAGVLLAEVGRRPAAVARLSELFQVAPLAIDPDRGLGAAHAARGLFMAFEAGALEAAA
ncbi:hypothetical protein DDF62_11795 [Caulobacter radicis]|uniref:hypothetical protein n=1 Tax=Caulobacter radicis TaxID=2172650 RepID=UPI000D5706FD|nr:hypothetical protein [Caulobacter radicis]PVM89196.1 hypothetical protein DDF62_11795 [Caulobacter radicis]